MDSDEDLPPLLPINRTDSSALYSQHDLQMPAFSPIRPYIPDDSGNTGANVEDDTMPDLMSVSDSSDEIDDISSYHSSFDYEQNNEWDDEDSSGWEDEYDSDEQDLPPLEPLFQEQRQDVRWGTREGGENTTNAVPHPPFPNTPTWFAPRRSIPIHRNRVSGLIPAEVLETLISLHFDLGPTEEEDTLLGQQVDLEQARLLVNGLERLPEGLLERMIRVGGAPGAYEDGGNDEVTATGCAICWTPLSNSTEFKKESSDGMQSPFAIDDEKVEIVSLPCAHVFHSSCLLPWFSRKTSCPTCRFNLDPKLLARRPTHMSGPSRLDTAATLEINPQSEILITDAENGDMLDVPGEIFGAEWNLDEPRDEVPGYGGQRMNQHLGPNQLWTLPAAPGLSLRERIEAREREMGMRCSSATCIYAPSDEDPQSPTTQVRLQTSISISQKKNCGHLFHPPCLVLHTSVAEREAPVVSVQEYEHSVVEVHCPLCHSLGILSSHVWEEGIRNLAIANDKIRC